MKIKASLLAMVTLLGFASCTSVMDEQAWADYSVCTGACYVSSSIRLQPTKEAGYDKAIVVIDELLSSGTETTRTAFKEKVQSALSSILSESITTKLVDEIMDLYDKEVAKLQASESALMALKSVKASIESGKKLAASDKRPVRVLPAE